MDSRLLAILLLASGGGCVEVPQTPSSCHADGSCDSDDSAMLFQSVRLNAEHRQQSAGEQDSKVAALFEERAHRDDVRATVLDEAMSEKGRRMIWTHPRRKQQCSLPKRFCDRWGRACKPEEVDPSVPVCKDISTTELEPHDICTLQCGDRRASQAAFPSYQCRAGTLEPNSTVAFGGRRSIDSFVCQVGECALPQRKCESLELRKSGQCPQMKAPACLEGDTVRDQEKCTPQCDAEAGWEPTTKDALVCHYGKGGFKTGEIMCRQMPPTLVNGTLDVRIQRRWMHKSTMHIGPWSYHVTGYEPPSDQSSKHVTFISKDGQRRPVDVEKEFKDIKPDLEILFPKAVLVKGTKVTLDLTLHRRGNQTSMVNVQKGPRGFNQERLVRGYETPSDQSSNQVTFISDDGQKLLVQFEKELKDLKSDLEALFPKDEKDEKVMIEVVLKAKRVMGDVSFRIDGDKTVMQFVGQTGVLQPTRYVPPSDQSLKRVIIVCRGVEYSVEFEKEFKDLKPDLDKLFPNVLIKGKQEVSIRRFNMKTTMHVPNVPAFSLRAYTQPSTPNSKQVTFSPSDAGIPKCIVHFEKTFGYLKPDLDKLYIAGAMPHYTRRRRMPSIPWRRSPYRSYRR